MKNSVEAHNTFKIESLRLFLKGDSYLLWVVDLSGEGTSRSLCGTLQRIQKGVYDTSQMKDMKYTEMQMKMRQLPTLKQPPRFPSHRYENRSADGQKLYSLRSFEGKGCPGLLGP